jgi:hypothetical protein
MLYINPNQTNQRFVVTLKEKWKDFDTTPESYLMKLVNTNNSAEYLVIPIVLTDNERYTQLRINTNTTAATSGSITIMETGEYSYTIYGQTGTTNLDPDDTDVIGVFEIGTLFVTPTTYTEYVNEPTIPTTIVNQ